MYGGPGFIQAVEFLFFFSPFLRGWIQAVELNRAGCCLPLVVITYSVHVITILVTKNRGIISPSSKKPY